MKKINYLFCLTVLTGFTAFNCNQKQQKPLTDQKVKIEIATLNDNIVKYELNINTGIMDTSKMKRISGSLTGIRVPLDIELDRHNKLYVLNQGSGSIPPQVTIYSDSAEGNIAPETVIDISDNSNLKPIGLTIADGTDFIFVSYFKPGGSDTSKITRFSVTNGGAKMSFKVNTQSLGDIEIFPSEQSIYAADPAGKEIIKLRYNSEYAIQPDFQKIQGSQTALEGPNSIALTSDGTIFVFDRPQGRDYGRINIYSGNSLGDVAPVRLIWNNCSGKSFIAPYGLAAAEYFGGNFIFACSGNNLTSFTAGSNGCADFLQRIDFREIGSPVAVACEKVQP